MPASMPTVSVVIPCRNEAHTLRALHERLCAEFDRLELPAEIIYIDDGSVDHSRETLRTLAATDPACRVIALRGPQGTATALAAGFGVAQGEFILTMRSHDDPQAVSRFLDALLRADVVCGLSVGAPPPFGPVSALLRRGAGMELHGLCGSFNGLRRQAARELTLYGERHRYLHLLAVTRGFRVEELPVIPTPGTRASRADAGDTLGSLLDLCTLLYLNKFRTRPLRLFGSLAAGCLLVALALGAGLSVYLTGWTLNPPAPPRWHFFMWLLDAALFTLSPVLFALGLLAEGQLASATPSEPAITERINVSITPQNEVRHEA